MPPVSSRTTTKSSPRTSSGSSDEAFSKPANTRTGRRLANNSKSLRSTNSAYSGRSRSGLPSYSGRPTAPKRIAALSLQSASASSGSASRPARSASPPTLASTHSTSGRTACSICTAARVTSGPMPSPGKTAIAGMLRASRLIHGDPVRFRRRLRGRRFLLHYGGLVRGCTVGRDGFFEQRQMRHQQAAQLAARFLRSLDCALMLAPSFRGRFGERRDLALRGDARLLFDEIGFLVSGGFDFVGGSLRENQRVLQRFLHRLEMADSLLEVGDFRLQRGDVLSVVVERFDDLVQELIDFRAIVALQRFLEALMLNVDRRDFLHRYPLLARKSSVPSAAMESRNPCALTMMPAGTTR